MMPANKLFLLLITCALLAFACTSSKRKSPTAPPIGGGDQSGDSSKELKELRDKLGTALSKISELQEQEGQGAVSQDDWNIAQQALTTAQAKIAELESKISKGEASAEVLAELAASKKQMEEMKNQMEEMKKQLASDSGGEKPTDENPDLTDVSGGDANTDLTAGGDAPVLHVSLVEVSEDESKDDGTYVTFHSDKDVVVNKIKYEGIRLTVFESYPTKINSIELPVYVRFTHGSTKYCVKATLGFANLPNASEAEGDKIKMVIDNTAGACD